MSRFPRASGILAHPTSFPGPFAIGDLGQGALQFLDFLREARQQLWQVLPLAPTSLGNSPYAAPSAFAGNPLLIALAPLLERGWLEEGEVARLRELGSERVDFDRVVPAKWDALRTAFRRFQSAASADDRRRVDAFQRDHAYWLEDYALFAAIHDANQMAWIEWEAPLRDREPSAMEEVRAHFAEAAALQRFAQFLFFEQWTGLRAEAKQRGVQVVGDIPIFVALDSADVWANRQLFKLEANGRPRVVAGVPPDYFSNTGQLWGNPLYDWDAMAREAYRWWVDRFRHLLSLVDIIRIDHFRGFQAAWEVPAAEKTAVHGEWVKGPGMDIFRAIRTRLGEQVPIVCEDLGLITDEVRCLLAEAGLPGMKVLQFAFSGEPDNLYLPHNFDDPNCVVYTGTHDNDSTRGWYSSASAREQDFVRRYLARSGDDIAWDLIRAAESSVADTAIVPIQDVLDLGSESRMNVPGAPGGNWAWRFREEQLTPAIAARLGDLTWMYGRAPALDDGKARISDGR